MKASLVHVRDPFRPQVNRVEHRVSRRSRIDTLLRRHGLVSGRGRKLRRLAHFVVTTDGKNYLLQDQWSRALHDGEVLTVINVPAGGGALRTLALIAVAVASIYTGGLVAAAYGATWGAVAGAAVTIAGSMLVNAVLPLPKPATGSSNATSTAYGIGATGNTAKLLQSIPVLYGRFNLTPDYAAQPYTEFSGKDQTLFALFAVTQGDVAIEQIRIGDTPIDNFAEAKYEVIPPGGTVTLFPDNVVTSDAVQGLELKKPSDGGGYIGPFVANPAGTATTQLAVDIGYPQGLYRVNKDGKEKTANAIWQVEAQQIDDSGNAIGAWTVLESRNEWRDDRSPSLYETHRYTVAAGRYQVRAKASEPYKGDGTDVNQIYWTGLRAYLPSQRTYGDITLLAVQIKATNNLNSSTARDINVTGTRKLPIWNGATWSAPEPTRSPAWAIADIIRNTTYGRGWPDNRINLPGLLTLSQTWATRGDEFNGVFDTKTVLWDALTTVARVGRAIPMYYAGVIDIIRDEPRTVPTLMLSPHKMVAGSFKVQYAFPTQDTPDHVVVTYRDPDTWQDQTVECALTGSPKLKPKNVTLVGCTKRDQAFREGIYMAACNRDQRKTVTGTTEMEGYIPRYGDLVAVSHDVPAWGISGQVVDFDPSTGILVTSEPAQWFVGQNHYIALAARNGSQQGPFQVVRGVDDFHLVLQGLSLEQREGIYVSDSIGEDPTIYQFGPGSAQSQSCLVTRAAPDGSGNVALTMVNYAYSVHVAEDDLDVPPPGSGSLLLNQPAAPAVGGVGVRQDTDTQTVWLSVAPVPGAVAYEFQVSYDNGVTWISVGVSTSNSIRATIPAGSWIVRARAIGALGIAGPWNQTPITVEGAPPSLGAVANFTVTGIVMGMILTWQLPDRLHTIGAEATEIWFGTSNVRANAQLLAAFALPTNSYTVTGLPAGQTLYFWARIRGTDAGNYSPEVGPVVGQTSSDASQILDYLNGQITKTQLAQDLLKPIETVDPEMAGDETSFAGDSTSYAGTWSLLYSQQSGDVALARRVDTVAASMNGFSALVQTETQARIDADGAMASQITTVQATAANAQATAQTAATTAATVDGKVSAAYTIKVQIATGGQYYAAGMAVGVDNSTGVAQSQILFQADRFALINVSNGNTTTPFVIQGGQTFINQAFIGTGWITNAMIGGVIQSTALDSTGQPLWSIDKSGGMTFRGSGSGWRTERDAMGSRLYDGNGVLRFRWGAW